MYAVIGTGGKQEKVEAGQKLLVERLSGAVGDSVTFTPLLLVDGSNVTAEPSRLASAEVAAVIIAEAKGPKIRGFTYKPKSNNRRRWGHRQGYHEIEVTAITSGQAK